MGCMMDAGGGSGYLVGPLGWSSMDGCAWGKLGCCGLKWLLLAFYSVSFPPCSTSVTATVSGVQVSTAIFMGALGNITARWGGNPWEDRKR